MNFVESEELSLDEWLNALQSHRPSKNLIQWAFPTKRHYDEFVGRVQEFPEQTVRNLLSRFLIPSGSLGIDEHALDSLMAARKKAPEQFERMISHTYFQRLLRYGFRGLNQEPPWEGITWVLDLLPHWPRAALEALESYFLAHCQVLPDGRIDGLMEAMGIIRARYIGTPGTQPERVQCLKELLPRDFEHLVAQLYAKMGFQTKLTPSSKDGGRDIEAQRTETGERQSLLIECKRYDNRIGVGLVRMVLGVVSAEKRSKGVLVSTSSFTRSARQFAVDNPRLELIGGPALVVLLNEHLGATWPSHLDRIVLDSKRQDFPELSRHKQDPHLVSAPATGVPRTSLKSSR